MLWQKFSFFESKTPNFFTDFFGEKKNITSAPDRSYDEDEILLALAEQGSIRWKSISAKITFGQILSSNSILKFWTNFRPRTDKRTANCFSIIDNIIVFVGIIAINPLKVKIANVDLT
jgi:hypothetical protein